MVSLGFPMGFPSPTPLAASSVASRCRLQQPLHGLVAALRQARGAGGGGQRNQGVQGVGEVLEDEGWVPF